MPQSPRSTLHSRFPVTNPIPSIWTAEPDYLDDYQSNPVLPEHCDVLIIGSGFAGAASAYHIQQSQPVGLKLVILDARKHCSGATGRNGGHIKPDVYYNVPKYQRLYGPSQAAQLAKFESSGVLAVKDLVDREKIECDFHLTRAVDVYMDPDHAIETYLAYQSLLQENNVDMKDVAYTSKRDAERVSGVKGAQCCFSFTAAHLWPKKLVQHLLAKVLEGGGQAYAHTPVRNVSSSRDAQGYVSVFTDRGVIKAKKVVFCANGFTASVLPQYADKIVPVRGVCCHITSRKAANTPHLPNTYSLRFGGANYDYLIPRPDGSIVVGGARQTFLHDKSRWFDSVSEDKNMSKASESYWDGYMQRHFRGWEDSGATTKRVWTGVMGYTSDFMPHIGEIPDRPGQFILAGFSGHGMPQILLASKAIADMVTKDISFAQAGLPAMFETTTQRLSNPKSELELSFQHVWESSATVDEDSFGQGCMLTARL